MNIEDVVIGGQYLWHHVDFGDDDNEIDQTYKVTVKDIDYVAAAEEDDECITIENDKMVAHTSAEWLSKIEDE